MSDFPSLADLSKQTADEPAAIEDQSARAKFSQKMKEVSTKEHELEAMRFASNLGLPHISLERFPVSQYALQQLPMEQAKSARAVCFYATPDEVRIGAVDPRTEEVKELTYQLEERTQATSGVYVISEQSLNKVLKLYETLPVIKAITKDINISEEELSKVQADVTDFHSLQTLLEKTSTSDLLVYLMGASLKLGSSDLHVEAEQDQIVVRVRLDGILHDAATMPKDAYLKLVNRIKLISSLKLNITDKPQDGRFTIRLSSGDVDIRVSTMPTVYGESIVMRLLRQSREGLSLDQIGLRGIAYTKLKREIERPNGMIITTGPTGSGKTTTLYSVMTLLNQSDVKIITLEDPVEYRMEGVNQSQIDRSRDYTFAKGLRSILRQDPDIAMVGEIRDLETADIAIQAALTGHLMLSTIHTNSAAGAIPRFLSMGVKPFLLAPALNSVIGQRLVRRICQECKEVAELSKEHMDRVQGIVDTMPESEKKEVVGKELVFYKGGGCDACNGIGYKGRIGIYEVLTIDHEIEQMILSGQVSEYEIEKRAIAGGMATMVQDGILKALDNITSVEEVFRVIE